MVPPWHFLSLPTNDNQPGNQSAAVVGSQYLLATQREKRWQTALVKRDDEDAISRVAPFSDDELWQTKQKELLVISSDLRQWFRENMVCVCVCVILVASSGAE